MLTKRDRRLSLILKLVLFEMVLMIGMVPLSAPVMAQSGTAGTILGEVRDLKGSNIPGATVTVTNLETGLSKTVVTNGDGYFEILALPRGNYSITVSVSGFKTWKLSSSVLN